MSVLQLADAKTYLNITDTASDAELQTFIDAAESSIAKKVGALTVTAQTYRARGGKPSLIVPCAPLVALVSVIPVNGVAMDVTQLNADSCGVIEYLGGGNFSVGFYDVSYTSGRATVPAGLLMAVKEHVRHLWGSQRGSVRRPGTDPAPSSPAVGAAYAFTYRVNELLAPYIQPGIA